MEQEFPDDGSVSGCALVYGVLLALAGVVLVVYILLTGLPEPVAAAVGGERAIEVPLIVLGLGAVGIGAGLWRGQEWAWWLILLLHSLAALLGLGVALYPLIAGEIGGRPLSGLATPATALLGVVVNIVIVAWFWKIRAGEDKV